LNEGEGLQVFALVVSSRPLPTYKEWRARRGTPPWARCTTAPGVVWRDNGADIEALTPEDRPGTRGQGVEVVGKTTLAKLTEWLRQAPDVDVVTAVGFGVGPQGP